MIQSVILSVFHSWFKTLQGTSWSKGRMPNSIFFLLVVEPQIFYLIHKEIKGLDEHRKR